jgi:hypothetical protein
MVALCEAAAPANGEPGRLRRLAGSPALWRVTGAVTAAALAVILFFAAPGSVEIVTYTPAPGGPPASEETSWMQPCLGNRYVALGTGQIAFCARTDGRVIASFTSGEGERHVLIAGGFHLTLVELKRGMHTPSWGSRIVAVGPLATTNGLRELHAITLVSQ